MSVGRNEKCPCGSGKKYKKCCLGADNAAKQPANLSSSSRFRLEAGSYGGGERQYSPSIICYEQIAPGEWEDDYCLVNTVDLFDDEDDASIRAGKDLDEGFAQGADEILAAYLKNKGYVTVPDFKRARD